jgi:hypothetical protein
MHPLGLRLKSVNALHTSTWRGGKGDAIIAATHTNFSYRADSPAENESFGLAAEQICLPGEDFAL